MVGEDGRHLAGPFEAGAEGAALPEAEVDALGDDGELEGGEGDVPVELGGVASGEPGVAGDEFARRGKPGAVAAEGMMPPPTPASSVYITSRPTSVSGSPRVDISQSRTAVMVSCSSTRTLSSR